MKKLGLLEVKQAFLADERFRTLFPELQQEMTEALKNPSCSCNRKLYDRFFEFPERLEKYFPNREVIGIKEELEQLAKNNFVVINCHVDELEEKLKKLPNGRKQIAVARFNNEITAIVNELDIVW
jgi:hypothetical protein